MLLKSVYYLLYREGEREQHNIQHGGFIMQHIIVTAITLSVVYVSVFSVLVDVIKDVFKAR